MTRPAHPGARPSSTRLRRAHPKDCAGEEAGQRDEVGRVAAPADLEAEQRLSRGHDRGVRPGHGLRQGKDNPDDRVCERTGRARVAPPGQHERDGCGCGQRDEEQPRKVAQLAGQRGGPGAAQHVIVDEQQADRPERQGVSEQVKRLAQRWNVHARIIPPAHKPVRRVAAIPNVHLSEGTLSGVTAVLGAGTQSKGAEAGQPSRILRLRSENAAAPLRTLRYIWNSWRWAGRVDNTPRRVLSSRHDL